MRGAPVGVVSPAEAARRLRRVSERVGRTIANLDGIDAFMGVQGAPAREGKRERLPDGTVVTDDSTPLIVVAAAHERGLGNNPRRSFLQDPVERARSALRRQVRSEMLREIRRTAGFRLTESDAVDAFFRVGTYMRAVSQTAIREGIEPALSERRRREKVRAGSRGDVPLIDTGQLRNSLRVSVEKDGRVLRTDAGDVTS